MGWREYKQKVTLKKETKDYHWLNEAVKEKGVSAVDDRPYRDQNAELYWEHFFDKKDNAEFVRTLERYDNGELSDDQLIIATSSILTHLHIEKDNDQQVPGQCVEQAKNWLNEFLQGDTDSYERLTEYI